MEEITEDRNLLTPATSPKSGFGVKVKREGRTPEQEEMEVTLKKRRRKVRHRGEKERKKRVGQAGSQKKNN